jgi:dTDP-4-amino-4,6-dideoxygalactose transaminase
MKSYKLYEPKFGKDELKAVKKVLDTGVLTSGKWVDELEEKFADYVGSKYAVAVNSCTSAIFLCLQYEKLFRKLKKVKIPSCTFISIANAIVNSNLELEFTDYIYVGQAYPLHKTFIIDSAHSLKRNCYFPSSLVCYSFYPTKLLGSCEGGMIATDDERVVKWLKKARNHGMERKSMFDWDYTVEFAGWKMNMNNIQAAIALERLKKLDEFNKKRTKIRDFYNQEFGKANESLHIYPLMIIQRDRFINDMAKVGIQCSVHFKPIHLQPAFKQEGLKLPISEEWGKEEVSIPLHENLTLNDAKYIIKQIEQWK